MPKKKSTPIPLQCFPVNTVNFQLNKGEKQLVICKQRHLHWVLAYTHHKDVIKHN